MRKRDGTCIEVQVKGTESPNQAGYFNVYDLDEHPEDRFFIVCVDLNKENTLQGQDWPNIWILKAEEFKEHMTSGHLLPIYDMSRKHENKRRRELLSHACKAWEHLTDR